MRPRGIPPMPSAASRLIAPVGIASTRTRGFSAPMRMMLPLPQFFSICAMARLSAFFLSSWRAETAMLVPLGEAFGALAIDRNLARVHGRFDTRRNYEGAAPSARRAGQPEGVLDVPDTD